MSSLKYNYLYNSEGVLTHIDKAIKGELYYFFDSKIEFIVRDGDINRKHFALKNNINSLSFGFGGGGESEEHYNAKMKIAHDLKYYDDIFEQDIIFSKVIPEKKQNDKIPDLSCYDESDNLIMLIEIKKTNEKSLLDIELLKKNKIPLIEIDINNDNKCKHLILPTLLEVNEQKLREIKRVFSESASRVRNRIKEEENRYTEFAEKHSPNINKFKKAISFYEAELQNDTIKRIEKIDNWLQTRIARNYRKEENIPSIKNEIKTTKTRITKYRNEIQRIENETYKNDYRLGKIESEFERLETELEKRRNDIREIAEKININKLRPKWMTTKILNKLDEVRYWCS